MFRLGRLLPGGAKGPGSYSWSDFVVISQTTTLTEFCFILIFFRFIFHPAMYWFLPESWSPSRFIWCATPRSKESTSSLLAYDGWTCRYQDAFAWLATACWRQVCCKLSTDLLQADCQILLSTGLLQVVSISCNKSENDKFQQAMMILTDMKLTSLLQLVDTSG